MGGMHGRLPIEDFWIREKGPKIQAVRFQKSNVGHGEVFVQALDSR